MKTTYFLLFLMLTALTACSEKEAQNDVPFEMMPEGLQKSIEAELIEKMKKEVIEGHQKQDKFFRTTEPIFHFHNWRTRLEIRRRISGETLIRGEVVSESMITDWVQKYYLSNEGLNEQETRKLIQDYQYEFYNCPFYSRITKSKILNQSKKIGGNYNERWIVKRIMQTYTKIFFGTGNKDYKHWKFLI
ncbi:MAG: hypothetical protein ACFHU9_13615 [Fluviicola sp.]